MSLDKETQEFISAHKEFSEEYITGYKPSMLPQDFNLFRSYFIQTLKTKFCFLLNTEYKFQLALNVIQVAFKAWDKIQNDTEYKKDFFLYFFASACFIVAKFDSTIKESDIQYIAYQEKYQYDILLRCEKAILCECHYKLYLKTPDCFLEHIFKEFDHLQSMRNYKESISLWIKFALSQYEIFSKYDYPTIVFACCVITFVNDIPENVEVTEEESDTIKNEFMTYLRKQKNIKKEIIESCGSEIIGLYEKDEDEEEEDKKETDDTKEEEDEKEEEEEEENLKLELRTNYDNVSTRLSSSSCIGCLDGLLMKYLSSSSSCEDEYEDNDEDYDVLKDTPELLEIEFLGKKRKLKIED